MKLKIHLKYIIWHGRNYTVVGIFMTFKKLNEWQLRNLLEYIHTLLDNVSEQMKLQSIKYLKNAFKKNHYGLKTGVIQGRLAVSNQTSKADEPVSHVYCGLTLAIKSTDGTVT